MGATCAITWLIGDRLYTANLGDSRIYLLRQGHIVQLTTDHTWVQEALDAGVITGESIDENPNAHVIRRYLGSKKPPKPDFRLWYFENEKDEDAIQNQGLKINPGDILLSCSDGLTDLVTDAEILEIIQSNPISDVPDVLVALANERGGFDNITVVVVESPARKQLLPISTKKEGWVAGCLGGLILLVALLAAVILGICFLNGRFQTDTTPTPSVTQSLPTGIQDQLITSSPTSTSSPIDTEIIPTDFLGAENTITPWPTHTQLP